MRFNPAFLTLVVTLLALVTSCGGREPRTIRVTIRNDSGVNLDWVKIDWHGKWVSAGVLSKGDFATVLDQPFPSPSATNQATLEFVEDASRKPHSFLIDLSEVKRLPTGRQTVTISIRSLTNAVVSISWGL